MREKSYSMPEPKVGASVLPAPAGMPRLPAGGESLPWIALGACQVQPRRVACGWSWPSATSDARSSRPQGDRGDEYAGPVDPDEPLETRDLAAVLAGGAPGFRASFRVGGGTGKRIP